MINFIIWYCIIAVVILLIRTFVTSCSFEGKDDRREQLYHDTIISIFGIPIFCLWCVLGICELVKHILGFK